MKTRNKALLAFTMAAVMGLTACGKSDKDKQTADQSSAQDKVYVVALDNTYAPFEFQKDGKLVGTDVDIMNAIAKDQGFQIKFESMDFGGIIPAMQAGKVDIGMGGMSITEERKQTVDFSSPYYQGGVSLVVSKDNKDVNKLADMKGKSAAVKNGTAGSVIAEKLAKENDFNLVRVNDSASMVQEVTNGSSAALFEDLPVISYAITEGQRPLRIVGEPLSHTDYGISVIKGKNQDVLKKINDGIDHLKSNGELDRIIKRYVKH